MVLLVSEDCGFCDKFKDVAGLVVAKIRRVGDSFKMELGGILMAPPVDIIGLPTLIVEDKIFIGRTPIEDYLGKINA